MIAPIGSSKLNATISPGLTGVFKAVNIPILEPAPTSAASTEVPTNNFGRMTRVPRLYSLENKSSICGAKNAAKDNTGVETISLPFLSLNDPSCESHLFIVEDYYKC